MKNKFFVESAEKEQLLGVFISFFTFRFVFLYLLINQLNRLND